MFLGERVALLDERPDADLQVHERADAARVGRKAPGEDRADVCIARIEDDALLEAAGDFNALSIKEALGQLFFQRRRALRHLDVDLLADVGEEARGFAGVVVVVEPLAGLAADAVLALDNPGNQIADGILLIGAAGNLGALAPDFQHRVDADRVRNFKRAHRHACHATYILDDRRRNAFGQHRHALFRIGAEHAAGVEAAEIVHRHRCLFDFQHIVHRLRERFLGRLLAHDDLDQTHALDRREEVDTDEVGGALRSLCEARDRKCRRVCAHYGVFAEILLDLRSHLRLEFDILEHGLDNDVRALDERIVR